MLFHSQVFVLCFLPVTIALYYLAARRPILREWLLILASLVFYGWWDVRFLPLLATQALGSWMLAELFFATRARWIPVLGIALNLAVLGTFKYLDFFVTVAEDATGLTLPRAGLILPIGISFYTFQIVAYFADTLGDAAPRYGVRRFSLFVVLFPQLIAGPIVRHNEIIPQFDLDPLRQGTAERISRGLALFILGFVLKFFVADRLGRIADPVFADAARQVPGLFDSAAGILAFALQIFFDFAAYSEMAIGIAMMMGLTLPVNFNQPYRATSLREFWRRWHMTLSRFLRDYLYIPLGGSRHGWPRYVMAALVTMGLCGLWHGAGWMFVLWGLLHGIGLVVCRAWQQLRLPMPAPLGWLLTFGFAVLLFGIFRAPDFATAIHLAQGLAGAGGPGPGWSGATAALIAVAAGIALFPVPGVVLVHEWLRPHRAVAAALVAVAVAAVLEVGKGQPQSFIYFQF